MTDLNFKTMTLLELEALILDAEDTAKAKRNESKQATIELINELSSSIKMKCELVEIDQRPTKLGTKLPVKYRDPITNKTWSGRGMTPLWLKGRLNEFAVI